MPFPLAIPDALLPQPERKVWHPVVWDHKTPAPILSDTKALQDEMPHLRIIRNIRHFLTTKHPHEQREKHIAEMILALPGASKSPATQIVNIVPIDVIDE